MTDVYVYQIDLPPGINEMTSPGWEDDLTIYVDVNLTPAQKLNAVDHAIRHHKKNDFWKNNVQQIEAEAHERRIK